AANPGAGTRPRRPAASAIPAGGGLAVRAGPTPQTRSPRKLQTAAAAAYHLRLLGIASIFVCIMLLTNSIMQAHGKVRLPIVTTILGGVVKVLVNYKLVGNPAINIKGAPIGTLACYGLIAFVNLGIVHHLLEEKPNYFFIFAKPVLASAVMGAAAWSSHGLLSGFLNGSYMMNSLCTLAAVGVAVLVYLILVIVLRMITREDLEMIPHGEKLAKLLRVR
ncbi:MAG: polysaccharide biosynthesis C-terminal domain-containing protein, partial [Oscillospiraceae bacterium]|nr:polysaccharide biosynthesis C-terminal domain-containing protein [Oscillospiraceae bacterium]